MGQNFIIAVCPYGGCVHAFRFGCFLQKNRVCDINQNDSIVLNASSVERGLGANLSYHEHSHNEMKWLVCVLTTRFDIHHPYILFNHPDIAYRCCLPCMHNNNTVLEGWALYYLVQWFTPER